MLQYYCCGCKKALTDYDGFIVQGNIRILLRSDITKLGEGVVIGSVEDNGNKLLKDIKKEAFCFKCFMKALLV